MARIDDIATNQDILNIANAIRSITRTTASMTIPQMPERLTQIRVVEYRIVDLDCSTGESVSIGDYDVAIEHMFIALPTTSSDAELLSTIEPDLMLRYERESGELFLDYSVQAPEASSVKLIVLDLLLPSTTQTTGYVIMSSGGAKIKQYSSNKIYKAGDMFIYSGSVGMTTTGHSAEAFTLDHNVLLANQVEVGNVARDLSYYAQLIAEAQQAIDDLEDGTTPAGKAISDANGNRIDTTYETKSDAADKLGAAKDYADSGLATKHPLIDEQHKLSSALVDDTSQTNKFVTPVEKIQITTNKNNIAEINQELSDLVPEQASASNKLADKEFVNSSINNLAAYYVTKDAAGNPFDTKAQLDSTTVFYSGGAVRTPTRNDYCYVLKDESKIDPTTQEKPSTRYHYDNGWRFQFIVNNSGLNAAQLAATMSGITADKVAKYDAYEQGIKDLDAAKQNKITSTNKLDYSLLNNAPTSTSDFENNGNGTSPYATEEYVDRNGGKIDKIKVNGVGQEIASDKSVNISVPVKTSEITNDGEGGTGRKFLENTDTDVKQALGYTPADVNDLGTAAYKDTGTSAGNVPVLNSEGKIDASILPPSGVTSITAGTGLTGGTITSEGTIAVDTTVIETKENAGSTYMKKSNPTGTGSFSLNRKSGTTIGLNSVAEGNNCVASGTSSHAEGDNTTASGNYSHAEGISTTASGSSSHSEGNSTAASGYYSHAEGNHTTAERKSQHVFGEYNILDETGPVSSRGNYVEIVGNGSSAERKNARTLDWNGNEWLAGTIAAVGGAFTNRPTVGGVNVALASDVTDVEGGLSDLAEVVSAQGTSITALQGLVPSAATSSNQLADKEFVNSSIENVAAYYITKNAAGDPFSTKAELSSATVFYSGGQVRTPTRNDYCIVLADESKQDPETEEKPTTRYLYDNSVWSFQYIVNNKGLTVNQLKAINSGITDTLVTQIGTNSTNIASLSSGKQDKISDLATIRSNASAGKSASDTIATYGNIVTHNTSEFATASQGSKADTAIQPNDNISRLNNDAGYTTNAGTITKVQLNGKDVASSGTANVQALPNFSLNISHASAGNPRPVKFLTVNYNTAATYFKMSATSCHDNGKSYQYLEDIIIGCTTGGDITCNVYKYCQIDVSYDGATRNYGDVFYVVDTTAKKVDFYILCGQWATSQFTPATKIGNTTIAYVTQYTGSAAYYSSGTKVWASGCGTTYARLNEIPTKTSELENDSGFSTFSGSYNDLTDKPTNLVTTDTEQTITGKKAFSGNGLKVSGRANGSGDDEGIVVSKASNNYAGICLGDPSGKRAVLYLLPDGSSVWRLNDGSSSYNIKHPGKEGTIATTDDIPTSYLSTISKSGTVYQENTNVEGEVVKILNKDGIATTFTNWNYFGNATTTENGLMSASDKAKLDNIDAQPRHYLSGDSQRNDGVFTYYKLASFPINDSGNACSLIINGRIGGWNKGNKGSISMIISNRDGVDGIGTILGNADLNITDLVVYTNSDNTATLYVKTYSWFAFDLTLGLMNGTTDIFDGIASTTTPSGTLAWSLSSAKAKFLSVADDGTTYVKGNKVATQSQLGTQATFSLSGTTLTITPK